MTELSSLATIGPSGPQPTPTSGGSVSVIALADIDAATATARPRVVLIEDVGRGLRPMQEGDVLLARISPSLENGKLAIARGLHGGTGLASPELVVLRPRPGVSAEWLRAFLRQPQVVVRLAQLAVGSTRPRVRSEMIAALSVPSPPSPAAQAAVVETQAAIDELAASAAQLIELVGQLPTAIVSERARGVGRRPLGEIADLRSSSQLRSEAGPPAPVVGSGDVVAWMGGPLTQDADDGLGLHPGSTLRPHDLLLPRGTSLARLGASALQEDGAAVVALATGLIRVRCEFPAYGDVLWAWLRTRQARAQLMRRARLSRGDVHVSMTALRELPVPVLPRDTVTALAQALRSARRQYRLALRSAALCGDLRNGHLARVFAASPITVPAVAEAAPSSDTGDLTPILARLSAAQQRLWMAATAQTATFTIDDLVEADGEFERSRRGVRLLERLGVVITERDGDVVTLRRYDPDIDAEAEF